MFLRGMWAPGLPQRTAGHKEKKDSERNTFRIGGPPNRRFSPP